MYSAEEIKRAVRDPHRVFRECNRLYHTRGDIKPYNTDGIDIFGQDWDNLILLDACRYDYFEKYADLPGQVEHRFSRAASTQEFIKSNFTNKSIYDTVYVSGNGHYFRLKDEINADLFGEFDLVNSDDRRDVLPEERRDPDAHQKSEIITEFAKNCAEKYPHKRLLVHFIPPHHPFRGPTAREVFSDLTSEGQPSRLYELIRRGEVDISDETLRTMYREELEGVLPHVRELLNTLPGKTVVSADHGELLGDRCRPIPHKGYGHHAGLYVDELVKVPWHVSQNGDRKRIVSEQPSAENQDEPSQDDIDEHLRALGYKT